MVDFNHYVTTYISFIQSTDWKNELRTSLTDTQELLNPLNEAQAHYQYEKGKWTIKEVVQHLLDAERIFVYRALRFARRDFQSLAGWDEELYAQSAQANPRTLTELLAEFQALRESTFLFFQALTPTDLVQTGIANGHSVSVEILGKLILGHHYHHLQILKNRYIATLNGPSN